MDPEQHVPAAGDGRDLAVVHGRASAGTAAQSAPRGGLVAWGAGDGLALFEPAAARGHGRYAAPVLRSRAAALLNVKSPAAREPSRCTSCDRAPRVFAVVLLLTVAACGHPGAAGVRAGSEAVAEPALVWPAAPERPRIRYRATVATPTDIGVRPPLWRRVVDAFTGAPSPRVRQPYGVAVDSTGRLFVADVAARGVHVFDAGRGRYAFRDRARRTRFDSPVGVAVSPDGGSFITDAASGALYHLDAAGREVWRRDRAGRRPTGIALDAARGQLYVVDTPAHEVLVYDTLGALRRRLGGRGTALGFFNYPTNIAVARDGTVYITDSMNFRVQSFGWDGAPRASFGRHGDGPGEFERAKGIAVDSEGHLYVVDGLRDMVNIYSPAGRLLLTFGSEGHGRGQFWLATGIAIDRHDRIYVADSFNSRVQVFQYLPGPL
ncbi:MAG: 6-bladed beta-propeller [Gemmatimonas sp.]|nr:6-bladed beta-propeller [Gemmatimonas sp.]